MREAGDNNPLGENASLDFALDQGIYRICGRQYPGLVHLAVDIHGKNVVPGGHHHAAVDGDGNLRGMGKHKAHIQPGGQL